MLKFIILFSLFSTVFAIPGSFEISFSRSLAGADSIPFLAGDFQLIKIGSNIEISDQFDAIFRCGFGSPEPAIPSEAFGGTGRMWTVETGADYLIHSEAPFFIRGTTGLTYILRDYSAGEYSERFADGSWESLFSVGLGSKFDLDFMPVISSCEFLLSTDWIAFDASVITGEIGFGI